MNGSPSTLPVTGSDPARQRPIFADGERVCWIGDSITHGGLWHALVTLYHQTRFPGITCSWQNCGLSGDSAAGALRRFDWDIAPHHPTVAVIMLGMNDVGRHLYAPEPADAARLAERRQHLETHARSMSQLADRLLAIGCRLILVSPSIFDDTGLLHAPNLPGVDRALAECGELARDLAARLGARFIDLHTPMAAANAALQRRDPALSLVGQDRVHPGPAGHLFMAYHILLGLGVNPTVASIAVDVPSGTVLANTNCQLTVVSHGEDRIELRYHPAALPLPLPEDARAACDWAPIGSGLTHESLRLVGLRRGRYAVTIDGVQVATASAEELADGLELGANPHTPQHRQALEIAAANRERHRLTSEELRTIAAIRHFHLDPEGVSADDHGAATSLIERRLAAATAAGNTFGIWQLSSFLRLQDQTDRIQHGITAATLAMRQAGQTRPLTVCVAPLGGQDRIFAFSHFNCMHTIACTLAYHEQATHPTSPAWQCWPDGRHPGVFCLVDRPPGRCCSGGHPQPARPPTS